jgi:hypothetical protein
MGCQPTVFFRARGAACGLAGRAIRELSRAVLGVSGRLPALGRGLSPAGAAEPRPPHHQKNQGKLAARQHSLCTPKPPAPPRPAGAARGCEEAGGV